MDYSSNKKPYKKYLRTTKRPLFWPVTSIQFWIVVEINNHPTKNLLQSMKIIHKLNVYQIAYEFSSKYDIITAQLCHDLTKNHILSLTQNKKIWP